MPEVVSQSSLDGTVVGSTPQAQPPLLLEVLPLEDELDELLLEDEPVPLLELDELELLELLDELDELDELLDEEPEPLLDELLELELLLDDELDEELELLDELEELLDVELELLLLEDKPELLELDVLEELLLEVPPLPAQVGATKLPSWLPWKPKTLVAVWPGAGNCQEYMLVNWNVLPGLVPVRVTFHCAITVTVSGKARVSVQPVNAVVPVLVTLTSTWKEVPPVLEGVTVQV